MWWYPSWCGYKKYPCLVSKISVTLEKMILKSQCKYFKLLFNHLIQHNRCGLHSWGYPLFSLFDTFFSLRLFIYHSFIFLVVYTCLLVVVEIETSLKELQMLLHWNHGDAADQRSFGCFCHLQKKEASTFHYIWI